MRVRVAGVRESTGRTRERLGLPGALLFGCGRRCWAAAPGAGPARRAAAAATHDARLHRSCPHATRHAGACARMRAWARMRAGACGRMRAWARMRTHLCLRVARRLLKQLLLPRPQLLLQPRCTPKRGGGVEGGDDLASGLASAREVLLAHRGAVRYARRRHADRACSLQRAGQSRSPATVQAVALRMCLTHCIAQMSLVHPPRHVIWRPIKRGAARPMP